MNKLKLTFLVLFSMLAGMAANAQTAATLVVGPTVICDGDQATLIIGATGGTVTKYEIDLFNNGNAQATPQNQNKFVYLYPPGNHTAKAIVSFSDGTQRTATASFVVYSLPVPSFTTITEDTQCFRGNSFCLRNLSSKNPILPSNPIDSFYFNWGDATGTGKSDTSFVCHTYTQSAKAFDVFLRVIDTKGCRAEKFDTGYLYVKDNVAPKFKWTFISGPCFVSCYQFKNTSTTSYTDAAEYMWDFGDTNSVIDIFPVPPTPGVKGNKFNYDTITYCYRKNGVFNPRLTITDIQGCTDSTRYTRTNEGLELPRNINFEFDIITTKTPGSPDTKDTVCASGGNNSAICFQMTPIPLAQPGTGDFVWDFGDPNDPGLKNLDSLKWDPCHIYSGKGIFMPQITIKNVCQNPIVFKYYSAVTTFSKFDSTVKSNGIPYKDNDYFVNPVGPPADANLHPSLFMVEAYKYPKPTDLNDSSYLYNTHTYRVGYPRATDTLFAYRTKGGAIVYFNRDTLTIDTAIGNVMQYRLRDSTYIADNNIYTFFKTSNERTIVHRAPQKVYEYKGKFARPAYFFNQSPLITDTNGVLLLDTLRIYATTLDTLGKVRGRFWAPGASQNAYVPTDLPSSLAGYGVQVIGPSTAIENANAGIVIIPSQKTQCGPTDTVDFVNTTTYFRSRKVWRRWDFGDDYAPQCTSFSFPQPGWPGAIVKTIAGVPTIMVDSFRVTDAFGVVTLVKDTQRGWNNANEQFLHSDHYFIINGRTYPGRMPCKFSHDSLPRHVYPNWDTVYKWYRYGHDFMPWNTALYDSVYPPATGKSYVQPGDLRWWGKEVFLNSGIGAWSLTAGTSSYYSRIDTFYPFDPKSGTFKAKEFVRPVAMFQQTWPRIDTMEFGTNNGQDIRAGDILDVTTVPDPIATTRSKYVVLDNYRIDTAGQASPGPQGAPITVVTVDGDTWDIAPMDILPNGLTFYEYVFRRTKQKCITVLLKHADSLNNESSDPGYDLDSLQLDPFDCNNESQVQLQLGKADAQGLSVGGRICMGSFAQSQANITFCVSAQDVPRNVLVEDGRGGVAKEMPGTNPTCGQSFIIMNIDSLADRKDGTPCDLDAFTTWEETITPGQLYRPTFNTVRDFDPNSKWTSANTTCMIYHYNYPGGPGANATNPPADTVGGWITIGVAIGNGAKDTTWGGPSGSGIRLRTEYRGNEQVYWDAFDPSKPSPPAVRVTAYQPIAGVFIAPKKPFYEYKFNTIARMVPVPALNDTLIWLNYTDPDYPKCVSTVTWYHNFIRVLELKPLFEEFPVDCRYRGVGDTITVFYKDSVQDSIRFSKWTWGDGTITVDSFWYAKKSLTDGFYHNGVRRVRYNLDLQDGTPVVIDSTVFPIHASAPGATDGLKPRTPGFFSQVNYGVNYCNNDPVAPNFIVVDTALMFLPVTHIYRRSSWAAAGSGGNPAANRGFMTHVLVSTGGCEATVGHLVTIGTIDTFSIYNSNDQYDTIFCEGESVYFRDSVRYWRYDCNVTALPDVPAVTRNPLTGEQPVPFPLNDLQIDPFDFWRYNEFSLSDFKGPTFTTFKRMYAKWKNNYDTIFKRVVLVHERLYWDFGDGSLPFQGTRPVHSYTNFGRYRVQMVSKDSMGFFDTCYAHLNIVKANAYIGLLKDVFSCNEVGKFWDSSYITKGPASQGNQDTLIGDNGLRRNWWWFGDRKDTARAFAENLDSTEYPYRTNGRFVLKLVVETKQGCRDTTFRSIFIKGPRPHFRLITLTDTVGCRPFKVGIVNMADSIDQLSADDTATVETLVLWGDGLAQSSILGRRDTVYYTYDKPGSYSIFAQGRDKVSPSQTDCKITTFPDTLSQDAIKVTVLDIPVDITASQKYICVDDVLEITNKTDEINKLAIEFRYDVYKYRRSDTVLVRTLDTAAVPKYTFNMTFDSAGVYKIITVPTKFTSLIPLTSYASCQDTDYVEVRVTEPKAAFGIVDSDPPLFQFLDSSSTNAVIYKWTLKNSAGTVVKQEDRVFNTRHWMDLNLGNDTGNYVMCLQVFVSDTLGSCWDSVCRPFKNTFITKIVIPNVFSPDGDGTNDTYKIDIEGEESFHLLVYNRWGGKVFESRDKNVQWNGKNDNSGSEAPAGTYFYIFTYKLRAGESKTENGTITLVR